MRVVIALGGNDWDRTDSRPAPNVAAFKTRYHETVTLARSHYPNAQILCTVAGSLNDNYPAGYNAYTNVTTILKAVVDERHKAPYEDPKVHYYELPRAQSLDASGAPDMSGCEGHSSASFHTRATADMTTKIKSITGW